MCKISVIMPVYNGEKYLAESIQSIVNQTFTDWELIIVNDCSTDSGFEIMKKYAHTDSRIKIINNKINMKLPASLNIGFENAKGEYLTWTSDDNLYKPNAFEEMYLFLEKNSECDMVAADYEIIDADGNFLKNVTVLKPDLKYYSVLGACFMYRKKVKDNIGRYDESMFLVEDYDYWIRIHKNYIIKRLDMCLYKYRNHSDSLSQTRYVDVKKCFFELRKKYKDFIFRDINKSILEEIFFDTYFYVDDKQECIDFFRKYEIEEKYIEIVKRDRFIDKNKKYVIFGCGTVGKNAFDLLNKDRVVFFADNNLEKVDTYICEKKVISFDFLKKIKDEYNIVLAVAAMSGLVSLIEQMEKNGIKNYIFWGEIISKNKG